ncbi:MAG: S8 family peptidase, partial [Bacteroidales bacterium]|nr:S8 family peptidase [Bacteroidales bacterium]
QRNRLFCMAVTTKEGVYKGIPSSWSSSIDKIIYGSSTDLQDKYLFIISGGNVFLGSNPSNYITINDVSTIKDPGQSFNALTIGTFTEKFEIDNELYPDTMPLAPVGGMGPSNSTSLLWDNKWAIKPDIVYEGGNLGIQANSLIDPDSLQLLTTNSNFQERLLSVFADTSCAAALVSQLASQISVEYDNYWPETIRGLIIHSADWTSVMLESRNLGDLNLPQKKELLRRYGFGVPNLEKALYSAKNSLTLIAEREIQPFVLENGRVRTKDVHTYELPFPQDILFDLAEAEVKLQLTLSYFIEPNPGNRNYSNKFNYQSHGLRFKMNNPLESLDDFKQRINSEIRTEEYESVAGGENWIIGPNSRNKGTIHKDLWEGTASELATKNLIAIFPVNGWYRTRPKLRKHDSTVRYSLIVSIEAPEIDIDLYTPIINQIPIEI